MQSLNGAYCEIPRMFQITCLIKNKDQVVKVLTRHLSAQLSIPDVAPIIAVVKKQLMFEVDIIIHTCVNIPAYVFTHT